jgi:hypothetical protein
MLGLLYGGAIAAAIVFLLEGEHLLDHGFVEAAGPQALCEALPFLFSLLDQH